MKMELINSFLLAIISAVQLQLINGPGVLVSELPGQGEVFNSSHYTGGTDLEITEAMLGGRNKTNITEVDLSSSGIIDILADAFVLLPNVEKIILRGNNLGSDSTRIGEYAFRGLPRLWYLDLSGNSAIVSLTVNPWTDLLKPNLTHLLVNHTQMNDAQVLDQILSAYSSLLYLDASSRPQNPNPTSYFMTHSLSSHSLQKLILNHCKLEMTDESLTRLTSLSRLSLNNVNMQPRKDDFMTTLIQHLPTSIQRLDLDRNDLTSLNLSLRNDLNQLTNLSLRENSFTALPLFASVIYDNLVHLDLSDNTQLSSYNFLGAFTSLQVLKISSTGESILDDNKLTVLLEKVESNLERLHLNGNYEITEFPDLSRFENLKRLELNNLSMSVITQENFQHMTMLEYLDISWNNLIQIADMRSHLTSLRTLKVVPQYAIRLYCDCNIAWMKRTTFNIPDPPPYKPLACELPANLSSTNWVDITYEMIMTGSNCPESTTEAQDTTTTVQETSIELTSTVESTTQSTAQSTNESTVVSTAESTVQSTAESTVQSTAESSTLAETTAESTPTTPITSQSDPNVMCLPDPHEDLCYWVTPDKYSSYTAADTVCKNSGGAMAIFETMGIYNLFRDMSASNSEFPLSGETYWIGLKHSASEYVWRNGIPLTWDDAWNMPSYFPLGCVVLDENMAWDDAPCQFTGYAESYPAICQKVWSETSLQTVFPMFVERSTALEVTVESRTESTSGESTTMLPTSQSTSEDITTSEATTETTDVTTSSEATTEATTEATDVTTSSEATIEATTETTDVTTSSEATIEATTETTDVTTSSETTIEATTETTDVTTSSEATIEATTETTDVTTSSKATIEATTETTYITTSSAATNESTTEISDVTTSSEATIEADTETTDVTASNEATLEATSETINVTTSSEATIEANTETTDVRAYNEATLEATSETINVTTSSEATIEATVLTRALTTTSSEAIQGTNVETSTVESTSQSTDHEITTDSTVSSGTTTPSTDSTSQQTTTHEATVSETPTANTNLTVDEASASTSEHTTAPNHATSPTTSIIGPRNDPSLPTGSTATPYPPTPLQEVGFVKEIHENKFLCRGISLDEAVQTICNYTQMCVCDLTSPLETVCSCLATLSENCTSNLSKKPYCHDTIVFRNCCKMYNMVSQNTKTSTPKYKKKKAKTLAKKLYNKRLDPEILKKLSNYFNEEFPIGTKALDPIILQKLHTYFTTPIEAPAAVYISVMAIIFLSLELALIISSDLADFRKYKKYWRRRNKKKKLIEKFRRKKRKEKKKAPKQLDTDVDQPGYGGWIEGPSTSQLTT